MADLYQDLLKDSSKSFEDGNYFLVTITDLNPGTVYPLQFRWTYKDNTPNDLWSAVKIINTPSASVPLEPQLQVTDVVGGAGFIKVTWSGNDTSGNQIKNFDRVDVHISGTTFGDGTKPAGSFKTSGTQTFTCAPGIYIVQLKVYNLNGQSSFYSSARTITVTSNVPIPESSVTPSTPTVSSVLGAIQLSWNGKTSSGGDQPYGFNAAKVYVGTSAGFTPSSSNQVDVLNFANGQNTLNIGIGTIVNGTALTYGTDYYVKIATTNGTDTSTAVSASGNPVRIGQVTSGDIVTITADKVATGTLDAGATITVGSTSGKHIKLSGTGDPFIIYGSGGTSNPVLSYNGNKLTIVGDGTFSGNLSAVGGTFTGTLSAATGSFSGTITASGGSVGGITIAADGIQNSGGTFKLDSAGKARFGSASGNSVIIDPSIGLFHSTNGSTSSGKFTLGLNSATIAGWTIDTNSINSPSTPSTGGLSLFSSGTAADSIRIQAGNNGEFKVLNNGSLIATNASLSGSLTTSGSFSGYTNNNLTINGGLISADKVIRLSSSNISSNGAVSIITDYIDISATQTEIFGLIKMSGITQFYDRVYVNTDLSSYVGSGSNPSIRNIWIRPNLISLTDSGGLIGDVWIQYQA